MKQLTNNQYRKLERALREAARIEAEEKRLEDMKARNRANLLQLIEEAGLVDENDRTAAPGVTVQNKRGVKFDASQALAWALDPANFYAAAPMLSVRKDAIATVIALALMDEKLKVVFELNKSGYEAAVREGTHVGLPFEAIEEKPVVAISIKNLKFGDDLRALFEIMPDDENDEQSIIDDDEVPF